MRSMARYMYALSPAQYSKVGHASTESTLVSAQGGFNGQLAEILFDCCRNQMLVCDAKEKRSSAAATQTMAHVSLPIPCVLDLLVSC